jgi:hypothetical protein
LKRTIASCVSPGPPGTAEAPLYIGGTDFATLAPDGRIKTVAGFMDASPAM